MITHKRIVSVACDYINPLSEACTAHVEIDISLLFSQRCGASYPSRAIQGKAIDAILKRVQWVKQKDGKIYCDFHDNLLK